MASERFLRRLALASAPLWAWTLHFFFVYALVAVGCDADADGARRLAAAPMRALAVLTGALALLAIGVLWRGACRRHRAAGDRGRLLDVARHAVALLAAIGIVWTLLPLLLLPPCEPV